MKEPKVKKATKLEMKDMGKTIKAEVTCPECSELLVGCTCDSNAGTDAPNPEASGTEPAPTTEAPAAACQTEKSLGNTTVDGAKKNVSDLVVYGNGDMFQLLCKASSKAEGWMKSTKAMQVHGGCLVQVTTQQRNPDGSYAIAEALQFVPGVKIVTVNGNKSNGRFLTRI